MTRPSPEMIVTGAVGAYLTGAAWVVLLLSLALGMFGGFDGGVWWSAGLGVGMVFVLLWVGGCICEGIGWIGVNRLHRGLAAPIGWATCTLPATYFILFLVGAGAESIAVFYLVMLIQVTLYAVAFVYMLHRREPGATLPALVGYGLAVVGLLGAVLIVSADRGAKVGVVFVYIAASGMALAHLAVGTWFRRAAREARALDVFA